jgi:parallel beta-helix repeat protein
MKKLILLFIVGALAITCKEKTAPVTPTTKPPVVVITTPIVGKTYYVDASKANSGDGLTEANAFKTLTEAANATAAGDVVLVKDGTYAAFQETTSGQANGWITWRAFPNHKPMISFDGWQGIYVKGSYVEIDGLTVRGNNSKVTLAGALKQGKGCENTAGAYEAIYNGNGIYVDSRPSDSNPKNEKYHHVTIKNCTVYECGGPGIGTIQADYITIENCKIYNNSWYSLFGTSGISLYQHYNSDASSDIKNIIRNNIVYGNKMLVPWVFGNCKFTDGNGIILDDFKNTQNGSTLGKYYGKTLIENNVVYNNGGRGIHAYLSENITIVNNTCYQNCASAEIEDGEITIIGKSGSNSENCSVYNNILYARTGKKVNTVSNVTGYVQKNNIYFNSENGYLLTTLGKPADPMFNNVASGDFMLKSTSGAIDYGQSIIYFPNKDILGNTRPKGKDADCGAYEIQ